MLVTGCYKVVFKLKTGLKDSSFFLELDSDQLLVVAQLRLVATAKITDHCGTPDATSEGVLLS